MQKTLFVAASATKGLNNPPPGKTLHHRCRPGSGQDPGQAAGVEVPQGNISLRVQTTGYDGPIDQDGDMILQSPAASTTAQIRGRGMRPDKWPLQAEEDPGGQGDIPALSARSRRHFRQLEKRCQPFQNPLVQEGGIRVQIP